MWGGGGIQPDGRACLTERQMNKEVIEWPNQVKMQ